MFIAKNKELIILARETREELEKDTEYMVYDSIEETSENYQLYEGQYLLSEEIQQKERARIAMLSLTAADVERAIYKAKGMDFEDVISLVEAQVLAEGEQPSIDVKALKIELKANNFYRGNPYIEQVGALLGFTSGQLDEFFETNDYTKLLDKKTDKAEN